MAYKAYDSGEVYGALRWLVRDSQGRQYGWGWTEAEAWADAQQRIAGFAAKAAAFDFMVDHRYWRLTPHGDIWRLLSPAGNVQGEGATPLEAVQDAMSREAEDG